jgi:hypothetical protein
MPPNARHNWCIIPFAAGVTLTLANLAAAQGDNLKVLMMPIESLNADVSRQFKEAIGQADSTKKTTVEYHAPDASVFDWDNEGSTNAIISLANSKLDVFLTEESGVKNLADRIERAVSDEPADEHSVLFDLQRRFEKRITPTIVVPKALNNYMVAYDSFNDTTTVRPPATTNTLSSNEAVAATLQRALNSKTQLVDLGTLGFMSSTSVLNQTAGHSPAAADLATAYSNVFESFAAALDAPASPQAAAAFSDAAKKFRSTYLAKWSTIGNDPAVRDAAAQTLNGLSEQRVLKAQYGVLTNFPPPSYEQIYYFSRHIVSVRASGAHICTGLALSKEWIVTAGHCLQQRSWADLKVVFDLDGRGKLSKPLGVVDLWPDPAPGSKGGDDIDFALMRVEQDSMIDALFGDLEQQLAAAPFASAKLCIQTQPVTYKEPVFAVGYPLGQNKMVHDYSYVWFPFKIGEDLYNNISAETYRRAQAIGKQYGRPKYAQSVLDDLKKAYRTTKIENGQTFHYYYGEAYNTRTRPYFGLDTSTFDGDSGSPIFARGNECVVGIFSGGQRDTLVAPEATWEEHEFAVPISEIISRVGALDKNQASGGRVIDAVALAGREALLRRITDIKDIR